MKQMKPLTKEQQEYVKLKTMFDRMGRAFDAAHKKKELPCVMGDIPLGYPKSDSWIEIFFYQRLEQLKQEKLKG